MWLPLELIQLVQVFLALSTLELDAAPQVGSHGGGVKGHNPLPCLAGHTMDSAQEMIGLLGCECPLLAEILFIHKNPQVLLHRAAVHGFFSQSVLISGIALTQVQHIDLVELQEVPMGLLLKLVQIPLDGILYFCCITCTTDFCVICKFADGALSTSDNLAKISHSYCG